MQRCRFNGCLQPALIFYSEINCFYCAQSVLALLFCSLSSASELKLVDVNCHVISNRMRNAVNALFLGSIVLLLPKGLEFHQGLEICLCCCVRFSSTEGKEKTALGPHALSSLTCEHVSVFAVPVRWFCSLS